MTDEELLIAHARDKDSECFRRCIPTATSFLTEAEQQTLNDAFRAVPPASRFFFFGGYSGAERCVLVFLPDYLEAPDLASAGLAALRISGKRYGEGKELSHRDYLGSLMGLGIKRESVGDILIFDGYADLILRGELLPFLLENLARIGNTPVTLSVPEESELCAPVIEYDEIRDTVASVRLDSLIASAFRVSRENAAKEIRAQNVSVGGVCVTDVSAPVREGARLSLRGRGKAIYVGQIGTSKKGRLCVLIHKLK